MIVTAQLAAPLAGEQPWVHLDAVLTNVLVRLRGPRRVVAPTSSDELRRIRLPLARQQGVWAASALWPAEEASPAETRWRMRPATEYGHLIRERIIRIDGTKTRARDEPLRIWPQRLWQARLIGQPAEVRKLLRQVSAIGKKTSQGYGRVIAWDLAEDEEGARYAEWGGIARRPLPAEGGAAMGVEPPYWYRPWWQPAIGCGEPR